MPEGKRASAPANSVPDSARKVMPEKSELQG